MATNLKPNDILVSALVNPNSTVGDLMLNGINTTNTQLLSPQEYKESDFIKKSFSDDKGNFNEELFNKAYLVAAKQYEEMSNVSSLKDLESYTKYNYNDLYAPVDSQKSTPSYEINKVKNPYRTSKGISSIFGEGKQTKSIRELAQLSKIWDSKNNCWLELKPDELGLFKSIFSEPLVYATWDEDGVHTDPITGRQLLHKKGDWKLNEDGLFYTETIGDREGYDKLFVAVSDTLTSEDSWLNKVDFFDSDGLTKNPIGTTFKLAAEIAPYMIPYFNMVWGGINAAILLSSVLPSFAKMAEGIIVGDEETSFTKKMNLLENYWKKYSDSYSDDALASIWGYQKMATLIGDIYGQLYQMKAMGALSNLKFGAKQKEIVSNFHRQFEPLYRIAAANPKSGLLNTAEGYSKFFNSVVDKFPEMKALIDSQSLLSSRLALGYMALTSSADVYGDAILHGYDRRMAGAAGLLAALGQYGIMMGENALENSIHLGTWFLDRNGGIPGTTMHEIKNMLRPYYDDLAKGILLSERAATQEKVGALAKLYNKVSGGFKNLGERLRDGSAGYFENAVREGVEEITEEAVMDTTKGIFDFLSWTGVGKNAQTASFGVVDDFSSGNFLNRYLQNFVGGAIGGALFKFLEDVVNPSMMSLIHQQVTPDVKTSIIREINNGNIEALFKVADSLGELDTDIAADGYTLNNLSGPKSAKEGEYTRGQIVANGLKNYFKYVEGIIVDEGLNTTDEALFKKALRDYSALSLLELSNVHEKILKDYNTLATEIVDIKNELNLRNESSTKNKEDELASIPSNGKYSELSTEDLDKLYKQKRSDLNSFLSGEFSQKYMKLALGYLNPSIKNKLMGMSIYDYTKAKYNVSYNELPVEGATLTKDKVKLEFESWRANNQIDDIFDAFVINAFDTANKLYSPIIKEYDESTYGDIRDVTFNSVLSALNFDREGQITDDDSRKVLLTLSKHLKQNGLPGLNLRDIFLQNPDALRLFVLSSLDSNTLNLLKQLPSFEESIDNIVEDLATQLDQNDYLNLNTDKLNTVVKSWLRYAVGNLLENLIDETSTKEEVDAKLIELGISPVEGDFRDLKKYFAGVLTSNLQISDSNIGLNTSALVNYFNLIEKIDGELYRALKLALFNIILQSKQDIKDVLNSFQLGESIEIEVPDYDLGGTTTDIVAGRLPFDNSDLDAFINLVQSGLNLNKPFELIIDTWLNDPETGLFTRLERTENAEFKALLLQVPDVKNKIKQAILSVLNSPIIQMYELARTKEIANNPLYDFLRSLNLELSEDPDNIVFDIIQEESTYLEGLDSASEYTRLGYLKDRIENAIVAIDLAQAIVLAMAEGDTDILTPFGFNTLIRRYLEKWEDGKDVEKYQTISSQSVFRINRDLELIRLKLLMLKALNDNNTESQKQKDQKIKDSFQESLLNVLQSKGSKLTLGGVSIYPPLDEIEKYRTSEEKIVYILDYVYQKFHLFAGGNYNEKVKELLDNSQINAQEIRESLLKSFGLDPDTKVISEYDYFVWLISTISSNKKDYLWDYRRQLNFDSYKKVPFFSLEYAAEIAYAFIHDTNKIHEYAVDWLYDGVESYNIQKAKGLLFVDGLTGAGKTSTVAYNIYASLDNGSLVFITAPNERQINTLSAALLLNSPKLIRESTTVGSKDLLFKIFLTDSGYSAFSSHKTEQTGTEKSPVTEKEQVLQNGKTVKFLETRIDLKWFKSSVENIPNVVFIDETTHFTSSELVLMSVIAEKYGTKFALFGDSLLNGASLQTSNGEILSNVKDVFTWKTPKLIASIRPQINLKAETVYNLALEVRAYEELTDTFGEGVEANKQLADRIAKKAILIPYYQSEDELYGDKFVDELSVEDILRLFKTAQKEANPQKRVIGVITKLGTSKEDALKLKLKDAGLTELDYKLYSFDNFHKDAVQGVEQNFFIIDDFGLTGSPNHLGAELKALYTFTTRSLSGSIIQVPTSILTQLGIKNEIRNRYVRVETPQNEEQSNLKSKRCFFISYYYTFSHFCK